MFKSLTKTLDQVGKDISRGIDSVSNDINKSIDSRWSSDMLDQFKTGNVLQFVSRSSGKTLQIVVGADGRLVVDGNGVEGPTAYNTHFVVTNLGKNQITLQNQDNFLSIFDGVTTLMKFPNPASAGVESHFQLVQIQNYIVLESVKKGGDHVGILKTGQLKSARASGRDIDSQFGIRVIYSPHPPPQPQGAAAGAHASSNPPPYNYQHK